MTDRIAAGAAIKRLAEEGDPITMPGFRRAMTRHGVEPDSAGRYDWAEILRARKAGQEMDKSKAGRGDLADLRRHELELKCKKLQLAIDEAEGRSMLVAEHDRILSAIGTEVRQRLEMIPGSVAPLAAMRPAHEVADILAREINHALQAIADGAANG